jgi:hypothetical protein
LNPRPHEA